MSGVLFLFYRYEEEENEIIKQLKGLDKQFGSEFVKSGFDWTVNHWGWPDKWKKPLASFKEVYEGNKKGDSPGHPRTIPLKNGH